MTTMRPTMRPTVDSAAAVVLVTKDGCRYCRMAKELLWSRGVAFHETNLSALYGSTEEMRGHLARLGTGSLTVPQVFVRGRYAGGYAAFAREVRGGRVTDLPAGDPRLRRPPWWPAMTTP